MVEHEGDVGVRRDDRDDLRELPPAHDQIEAAPARSEGGEAASRRRAAAASSDPGRCAPGDGPRRASPGVAAAWHRAVEPRRRSGRAIPRRRRQRPSPAATAPASSRPVSAALLLDCTTIAERTTRPVEHRDQVDVREVAIDRGHRRRIDPGLRIGRPRPEMDVCVDRRAHDGRCQTSASGCHLALVPRSMSSRAAEPASGCVTLRGSLKRSIGADQVAVRVQCDQPGRRDAHGDHRHPRVVAEESHVDVDVALAQPAGGHVDEPDRALGPEPHDARRGDLGGDRAAVPTGGLVQPRRPRTRSASSQRIGSGSITTHVSVSAAALTTSASAVVNARSTWAVARITTLRPPISIVTRGASDSSSSGRRTMDSLIPTTSLPSRILPDRRNNAVTNPNRLRDTTQRAPVRMPGRR